MSKEIHNSHFPDEVTHLKTVMAKLDIALQQAKDSLAQMDNDYREAKRYMADYRGEIDPHEMFQNELALKQLDRTGAFAADMLNRLVKLKESAYFARLDFREKDSQAASIHYIGRFAFSHAGELLISDWRSPIATVFYDYEPGAAGYRAPLGRIEGELIRKRQFKIKNGVLEYALESALNIQDDLLRRELAHTADDKMKSIIATIQKEQNRIIRSEKSGTIIIQGVAGSGKTSIALHRIAFLLYRYRDNLTAKNIVILSPNKVFGDYISTVLPELGEEPINQISLADIAATQLQGIVGFEPDKYYLETDDTKWAERALFKSTGGFLKQLDSYIQKLNDKIFVATDFNYGRFTVSADWLQTRFAAYFNFPIKKRLQMLAADAHVQLVAANYMDEDIPRPRTILNSLNKMLKIKNSMSLYKEFYKWLGCPQMLVLAAKKTLEWADVYPLLYIQHAFEGLTVNKLIKHLVIDEMQDYTPVQYAVLNLIFNCDKTILGDFGQSINPNHLHSLDDIQQLYSTAALVRLNKSYRSTCEIIMFAKRIKAVPELEPIERHGDIPQLTVCQDKVEQIGKIKEVLDEFGKGEYLTMGVIVKTSSAAKELYELLSADYNVHLLTPASESFTSGITVTSVRIAKGLEFDQVLIVDVDNNTYRSEYDASLLYVAATRALHHLTLMCVGSPAELVPSEYIVN